MPKHALKWQKTLPPDLPEPALDKIVSAAVEYLRHLAGPRAHNITIHRKIRERKTKIGRMWDLLVSIQFDGPITKNIKPLKEFHDMQYNPNKVTLN